MRSKQLALLAEIDLCAVQLGCLSVFSLKAETSRLKNCLRSQIDLEAIA